MNILPYLPPWPREPIGCILRPMLMRTRLFLPLLVVLAACDGGSHPASSSGDHPYKVSFVNDTAAQVDVVACPACGTGQSIPAGHSWDTGMTGGAEDVFFRRGAAQVGCVHFMNGLLPTKNSRPSIIPIAANSPCRS